MKQAVTFGAALVLLGASYLPSAAAATYNFAQLKREAAAWQAEWVAEHAGGSPVDVLRAKFDAVVAEAGQPTVYFRAFDGGRRAWEHAAYVADRLGLDYESLAYLQMYNGTYGIELTVAAMDQSVAGVAETLAVLRRYHGILHEDRAYFADIFDERRSAAEQAAAVIARCAENYRTFFAAPPALRGADVVLVDDLVRLTGLSRDHVECIAAQYGLTYAFNVTPNVWNKKHEALARIGQDYSTE